MRLKATLKGDKELIKKFKDLQGVTENTTVDPALMAGALIIQNAAVENAPYLTGTLRRSIHIEITNGDESS